MKTERYLSNTQVAKIITYVASSGKILSQDKEGIPHSVKPVIGAIVGFNCYEIN